MNETSPAVDDVPLCLMHGTQGCSCDVLIAATSALAQDSSKRPSARKLLTLTRSVWSVSFNESV